VETENVLMEIVFVERDFKEKIVVKKPVPIIGNFKKKNDHFYKN